MLFITTQDKDAQTASPAVSAPHPAEFQRLLAVCGLDVVEPGLDQVCDEVVGQATALCCGPMGLVAVIHDQERRVRSKYDFDAECLDRNEAFCAQTILQDVPIVVEDARQDSRFAHLALVTEPPYIRFYASAPIVDGTGLPLGVVCVLDSAPHPLSNKGLMSLHRLATMMGVVFETRRIVVSLLDPTFDSDEIRLALERVDEGMVPLFAMANGFRPSSA